MSESPEELTPEQEELAQQFAAELEGVGGGSMEEDDEGVWWFTFGDFTVPVSAEQRDEFADALYNAGLAKVYAMQREAEPTQPYAQGKVLTWTFTLGLVSVAAWGIAKLFGLL